MIMYNSIFATRANKVRLENAEIRFLYWEESDILLKTLGESQECLKEKDNIFPVVKNIARNANAVHCHS